MNTKQTLAQRIDAVALMLLRSDYIYDSAGNGVTDFEPHKVEDGDEPLCMISREQLATLLKEAYRMGRGDLVRFHNLSILYQMKDDESQCWSDVEGSRR
jgi:hypothetical protein